MADMHRAYSVLEIKALDEKTRTFEGIASTPTPDRMEDIVDPKGAKYTLPIPLLWQHARGSITDPVGWIDEAKVTSKGITVKGRFAQVDGPPSLKEDFDRAWTLVKEKLVRGLSIGFNPTKWEPIPETMGFTYTEWDWLELSAVTIPANADANITSVKSADRAILAATGTRDRKVASLAKSSPGATGSATPIPKGKDMKMTTAEQIASWEAKRAASAERMGAIMEKSCEEGRALDDEEKEEYENLNAEVKACDEHIVRLKDYEKIVASKATPVEAKKVTDPDSGSKAREPSGILSVRPNVPKGIAFARYAKALINGQGNPMLALMYANQQRHWEAQTPEVAAFIKAAVEGGTTTTSGWASEWVYNQNLVSEFIELLRPATVIGRLPGLRQVPFNVRVNGQDSGSTAYWSGQGAAIPVSKLNSIEVTLGIAKATGLVVLTDELVRSSEPSAEMKVRDDLIASIAEFSDRQFLDPGVAEVTNVSPASITNGVTPLTPTGTNLAALRADVQTLFRDFINVNDNPRSATWIMDTSQALAISMMQNALSQNEFPNLNMEGGIFMGLPAVVSNAANIAGSPDSGRMIILAKTSDILFADDGNVAIDASREASIEMTDAPSGNAATGTAGTTSLVSMYQSNSVAVRAVRYINWKKARSTAVAFIQDAAYVA